MEPLLADDASGGALGPALTGALGTLIGSVLTAGAAAVVMLIRARGSDRRADQSLVFEQLRSINEGQQKAIEKLQTDLNGMGARHDARIDAIERDYAAQIEALKGENRDCHAENKALRRRVSTLEDRVSMMRRQIGDGMETPMPHDPEPPAN